MMVVRVSEDILTIIFCLSLVRYFSHLDYHEALMVILEYFIVLEVYTYLSKLIQFCINLYLKIQVNQ
jgi:hypothetical protein